MALEFKKAKRIQAKIKIAIGGASGSGKTMSSLLLGYGLVKAEHPEWTDEQVWDHIAVLDTENSSASLYVGKRVGPTVIGSYNVIDIEPPFEEQVLIDALTMCEQHQIECAIIDSASAFWTDALETQGKIAERTKSNFSAWKPVKADQNKMMQAILQCRMHVISNYRAKIEYTQDVENGKKVVKSLGMGIIAEGNTSYEYTTMFMLDDKHEANATKDRTGIFDGQFFVITAETGRKLYQWMAEGEVAPVSPAPEMKKAEPATAPEVDMERVKKAIAAVDPLIRDMVAKAPDQETKDSIVAMITEILGDKNYKKCTDLGKLTVLYKTLKEIEGE